MGPSDGQSYQQHHIHKRRMKRRIIMACLLIACWANLSAQSLYVINHGTRSQVVSAGDIARMDVRNDSLYIVSTQGRQVASFPLDQDIFFALGKDTEVGIGNNTAKPSSKVSVRIEGARINIDGAKEHAQVALYDTDGRLLKQTRTTARGHAEMRLDDMPQGVYILRTDDTKMKLKK